MIKSVLVATFIASAHLQGAAEVRSYEFTGTVTYSSYMHGHKVRGTFSFDDAMPGECQVSWHCAYTYSPPSITLRVGPHTITSSGVMNIIVVDENGSNTADSFEVNGTYPLVVDGTTYPTGYFGIGLYSGFGPSDALTSTALPVAINLDKFQTKQGYVRIDGGQTGTLLLFTLDALTLQQK